MSIREETDKRVSFNARDELGDKIDKLTIVMSKLAAIDNHERIHSSQRYIRVGDRTDPMARGDISLDQMIGTGTMAQAEIQDKTIEVIGLEETLEGIIGKTVERDIGMKGIAITAIEIEIDQGREHLRGTIEETEVLAMIGLGQGLEQAQTWIE